MPTLKHANLSIPTEVMEEAKGYGINISAAATTGIKNAIQREKKIRELGL